MIDLKTLCDIVAPSGSEKAVCDAIKSDIEPFADSIRTDALGNLIAFRKGKQQGKTVLVAAHMDEVGFMVKYIAEDGRLLFDAVGGLDARVVAGKRVSFTKNGKLGVIASKAIHIQTADELDKATPINKMYIDIGVNTREEAEKFVLVGDVCSFIPNYEQFGEGYLKSKAIDDRFGCYALCRLIREEPEYDTYFAFTNRE